jgi:NADPH:quinone reductase-like Zn-dependent oxidoreductase
MKGVVFEAQGAEPKIVESEMPKPTSNQILVKSLYAAMNPM